MPRRTAEEQKAYNRAKTAKYRAKKGKAVVAAQARAVYHQHDDNPILHEAEQEKRRARGRRWYANHAAEKVAKVMARSTERANDPVLKEEDHQIHLKAQATFRLRHPEKALATSAAYKKANPDKVNASRRARQNKNPEKHRAQNAKREAQRRGAPRSDFTTEQWEIIKTSSKGRCVYCGEKLPVLTKDHLTPVSDRGPDTMQNIIPACRSCNSKKGTGKVLKPVQPFLL